MFMAASCDRTEWVTIGTFSGSSAGFTTAPSDRVTDFGIPPTGHRVRWMSHQNPSKLSKEWFSRKRTTTCLIGILLLLDPCFTRVTACAVTVLAPAAAGMAI